MMNRFGLDRFKKATSAEPFSVTQKASSLQQQQQRQNSSSLPPPAAPQPQPQSQSQFQVPSSVANARVSDPATAAAAAAAAPPPPPPPVVSTTALGAGGSSWQPPDWAAEPKSSLYWLDVMKEGEVVDKITLDRKRLIFGRQQVMCELVLDHPSVSRQHAAIVHHKNGGIYVIDLGSVHGTFVANERLNKDSPVELEVGQSLRFAASTRMYVLRQNIPAPAVLALPQADIVLPPPPDPSDSEAVLAYNTSLNRLGVPRPDTNSVVNPTNVSRKKKLGNRLPGVEATEGKELSAERPSKKGRTARVSFRDEYGGILAEVVGVSDGADVGTEPGPVGVREGSLVGKYESLVQVTVIPKGQEDVARKAESGATSSQGVTQRLQQYLDKVKSPAGKSGGGGANGGGLYDGDMYGESLAGIVGGSWATSQSVADNAGPPDSGTMAGTDGGGVKASEGVAPSKVTSIKDSQQEDNLKTKSDPNFNDDDLFGEDEDT